MECLLIALWTLNLALSPVTFSGAWVVVQRCPAVHGPSGRKKLKVTHVPIDL